jgi:dTDP-4-dehydrorhamnose reductase
MGRASGWKAAEEKPFVVLGAGGLVATAFVDALERHDYHYVALSEKSLDITYEGRIAALLKGLNPQVIINAAGFTDIDGAETDRDTAFEVNGAGAGNVAAVAAEIGALVVQMSSDYVFDGSGEAPWQPDDETSPVNVYGSSKLEGEKQVRSRTDNHLIIRSSLLYGQGRNNIVDTVLSHDETQILDIPGDMTICPTYTSHFAESVLRLANLGAKGTHHLCNSGQCTLYEFAREVARTGGGEAGVSQTFSAATNRPAARILNGAMDCTKTYEFLGEPLPSWQEGLEQYLEDQS